MTKSQWVPLKIRWIVNQSINLWITIHYTPLHLLTLLCKHKKAFLLIIYLYIQDVYYIVI